MGYGMLVWIAAVVAQGQEPAAKAAAPAEKAATPVSEDTSTRLKEARRLLRNGRYAEAEEKLKAIRDDVKAAPGGLSPEVRVTISLDEAECRASQGEYGKAIEGLKAAETEHPKNADLPARLADLSLLRGDWGAADRATSAP